MHPVADPGCVSSADMLISPACVGCADMTNINPSAEAEKRSPLGVGAKATGAKKTPNLSRLLRRRSATTWTHSEGSLGGTTYYYKVGAKFYAKFIPNWADERITCDEVVLPSNLEGKVEVCIVGYAGSCIAGGMQGKHAHFVTSTQDYCPLAENIAYTS